MKNDRLLISFSGGETSAYMTQRLIKEYGSTCEIIVLFANTGQEAEETLEFVKKCDEKFNLNTIWVEAKVNPIAGKGTQPKIVDFWDASRNGEPFRDVIKKYGIPNRGNPVCTRELKISPMKNYMRSIGWNKNQYTTAIGIRVDELDRQREDAETENIIYPLIDWNIDKPAINKFWENQDFRLNLKSWEGNCKTCWKKSNRKLYQIAQDHPEWFDFFAEMEFLYSGFTPKNKAKSKGKKSNYLFFSRDRDVTQILSEAYEKDFDTPTDDRLLFDDFLDSAPSCTESCEAY